MTFKDIVKLLYASQDKDSEEKKPSKVENDFKEKVKKIVEEKT